MSTDIYLIADPEKPRESIYLDGFYRFFRFKSGQVVSKRKALRLIRMSERDIVKDADRAIGNLSDYYRWYKEANKGIKMAKSNNVIFVNENGLSEMHFDEVERTRKEQL